MENPFALAPALATSLVFTLDVAFQIVCARTDQIVKENMALPTRRHFWVLLCINGKGGAWSQQKAAKTLGINPNVMVEMVDFLESSGYLRRVKNADNRRENLLQITAKGKKTVSSYQHMFNEYCKNVFEPLTPQAAKQFTNDFAMCIIEHECKKG